MTSMNRRQPVSTSSQQPAIRRQPVDITIEPVLVDITVACDLLGGISRRTLDQLVADGHLVPRRIRSRVLFTPDELRRFAATCPEWGHQT